MGTTGVTLQGPTAPGAVVAASEGPAVAAVSLLPDWRRAHRPRGHGTVLGNILLPPRTLGMGPRLAR